jgi:esterase/lipase superfamily enzyme
MRWLQEARKTMVTATTYSEQTTVSIAEVTAFIHLCLFNEAVIVSDYYDDYGYVLHNAEFNNKGRRRLWSITQLPKDSEMATRSNENQRQPNLQRVQRYTVTLRMNGP